MERFTLRIASKRQVTVPARLLQLMHLSEGDVLELVFERGQLTGRGLKLVPSSFFSPDVLDDLKKRQNELDGDKGDKIKNIQEIVSKLRP